MEFYVVMLLLGIAAIALAIKPILKTIKLHRAVDSRAKATVTRSIDLGVLEGRKVYAVTWTVDAPVPFDILVTPCKKCYSVGRTKHVNYERANPKNHYFGPSVFDSRFAASFIMIGGGAILIIRSIADIIMSFIH